jgi:hypothetical protein
LSREQRNEHREKRYIMRNSFFRGIVEAYKENAATVVCGMAMMSGQTNVYQMYRSLQDSENK